MNKCEAGVRAHQKLFAETTITKPEKPTIGRNKDLITARNTDILYRYYYFSRLHKMKYGDTLDMLCVEFRLTSYTVGNIIAKNTAEAKKIIDDAPKISALARLLPQYHWRPYKKTVNNLKSK